MSIARNLRETIRRVLALSLRQGSQTRLMGRLTKLRNAFRLENDPLLFAPLIQYLQDGAAQFGLWGDAERNRISVALEEALTNALYHGNLEIDSDLRERNLQAYHLTVGGRRGQSPYRERRIEVEAEFSAERAVFVVRDEGAGFDPTILPDPTDPANLTKPSGRGILLMRAFMDEVTYNAVGNSVALVKNREADHRIRQREEIMSMKLFTTSRQGDALVAVAEADVGSLGTANTRLEVDSLLMQMREWGVQKLVFDMSKAEYFGSQMIELMIIAWRRLASVNGILALCRALGDRAGSLHTVGLDKLWPTCNTLDEALAAPEAENNRGYAAAISVE